MSSEGGRTIEIKQGDDIVPDEAKAATSGGVKYELPPRYRDSISSFMKRAQDLDKEYRHRWVHISPRNQTVKSWSGWTPLVDKEKLTKLGLKEMVVANGRARWMDTELWVMPNGLAEVIKAKKRVDLAERSSAVKDALEAEAAETAGRTRGKAQPYVHTGPAADILEKIPMKIESIQQSRAPKPKE